jgi:hypothetical protein
MSEQEFVADLARARLVPPGVVGELNVADAGDFAAECGGQLAFHALRPPPKLVNQRVLTFIDFLAAKLKGEWWTGSHGED